MFVTSRRVFLTHTAWIIKNFSPFLGQLPHNAVPVSLEKPYLKRNTGPSDKLIKSLISTDIYIYPMARTILFVYISSISFLLFMSPEC